MKKIIAIIAIGLIVISSCVSGSNTKEDKTGKTHKESKPQKPSK
jgi:PBP1b-binding outer membrane lipoprotein LpoB